MQRGIIALCRPGFEAECARDLERIGTHAGARITCDLLAASAFVVGSDPSADPARWQRALQTAPPWFARSIFLGDGPHALPRSDRLNPLLAIASHHNPPFA